VFTGHGIETAVFILLLVFVAVRMFTEIPLLLRNLATNCLPRICLRGNVSTNPLPGNTLTFLYKGYRKQAKFDPRKSISFVDRSRFILKVCFN
jgi:hypothetical protein